MAERNEYLDRFEDLLSATIDGGIATDLHIQSGTHPLFRIDGQLESADGSDVLSRECVERMMDAILTDEQRDRYKQAHAVDFAYTYEGRNFRVNIAGERNGPFLTARVIPDKIREVSGIFPNNTWKQIVSLQRGLVLVTGVTGSGKSTTLAGLINHINKTYAKTIITLEDPIEYVHTGIRSSVKQRELYRDVRSFSEGVSQAMRQDPNVIVVGETRDSETLQGVVNAADTGHLVFSTLHTRDSAGTITRCLDFVSGSDGNYIRGALADNLEYIACQQLVPGLNGGLVLAMEIMKNTAGIRNLIRTGKLSQIPSAIQSGANEGMVQMDSSLLSLYRVRKISGETAIGCAMDRDTMAKSMG